MAEVRTVRGEVLGVRSEQNSATEYRVSLTVMAEKERTRWLR
jgi:hypothetical protein